MQCIPHPCCPISDYRVIKPMNKMTSQMARAVMMRQQVAFAAAISASEALSAFA